MIDMSAHAVNALDAAARGFRRVSGSLRALSGKRRRRVGRRRLTHGRRGALSASLLLGAFILGGCFGSPVPRLPRSASELAAERRQDEQSADVERQALVTRNISWVKRRYDAYADHAAAAPPIVDILVISGGGDWGAFGAGVLQGWSTVTGPMARPTFAAVTGVSTGALIAPFAFIGDEQYIDQIVELYRNPKKDWFLPRRLLSFLVGGASYAEIPGLEKDIRRTVDKTMLQRIVEAGEGGRFLVVNTSNIDFGVMHAWDLVAEARRALASGSSERFVNILLASSAVPGAFPPREIDGDLYVDGGVTGNILYGGAMEEEQTFTATWQRSYPGLALPRVRYWVIFNNQVQSPPETVQRNWKSILPRSLTTSTRTATLNSLRHLYALAEIAHLTSGAEVEVRYIAVPDDWKPPVPGVFKKEVMNTLADLGERMGADPANWRNDPP